MENGMMIMVWIGALLTAGGLAGLIWCIRKAAWLKSAQLQDEEIRAAINGLILWHMAAIGAAFFGLGLLVIGLMLS